MFVAGIDIGTTTVCCVLADTENGGVVKTLTKVNDSSISSSHPWEALQDPERIVVLIHELLQAFEDEWEEVAAIGISCQMHGILYVNANGRHVSPLYTWQDRRGEERYSSVHTYVSYLEETTGYRLSTGFGMVTHFYNLKNGIVPKDASSFCTIGDYIAMRLCGLSFPVLDVSNAGSIGMFSLDRLDFDYTAMAKAGMDSAIVPKVAGKSCDAELRVGTTLDQKSVICAIGDNQASFLGTVPYLDRTLLINIGTGSQMSVFSDKLVESTTLEIRPFPGGGYLIVGASLSGGKSYALLEQFFKEVCRTFTHFDEHSLFEQMNRLAEEAVEEWADMPLVRTQFYASRHNSELMGRIDGLHYRNFTPKHFIIGFLNGILDELLEYAADLPDWLQNGIIVACGSGNGVRKNPVMRELLKKRLNFPFYLADVEEEAAYGAAIHAGVGCGLFPDYQTALNTMRKNR